MLKASPPTQERAGFGVPLLQWLQVRDSRDTHKSGGARTANAPGSWYPGVEHQCGTETAPGQSELAGGQDYLRDVEGAVQALQMKQLTIQSQSAALQPAREATSILRLPASRTPKARCRDAVRLAVGFSMGAVQSSNKRASQAPPACSFPASPLPGSGSSGFGTNSRGDSAFLCSPCGSGLAF
jgi:hypothetical protein